jgi:hypothetical protein
MFQTRVLRTRAEKAILRKEVLEDDFFYFDLDVLNNQNRIYVVVVEGDEVVGMVSVVDETMWAHNALGVGFLETKAEHRKRGICKLLVDGLFQLAQGDGKDISNTPYSPNGFEWLKPVMHETAKRYPEVRLYER